MHGTVKMAAVWSLLRSLLICLFLLGPGLCRKDMWEYTDEDLDRLEKQWEVSVCVAEVKMITTAIIFR